MEQGNSFLSGMWILSITNTLHSNQMLAFNRNQWNNTRINCSMSKSLS